MISNRITRLRSLVLQAFVRNQVEHLSVEVVFQKVVNSILMASDLLHHQVQVEDVYGVFDLEKARDDYFESVHIDLEKASDLLDIIGKNHVCIDFLLVGFISRWLLVRLRSVT